MAIKRNPSIKFEKKYKARPKLLFWPRFKIGRRSSFWKKQYD